MKRRAHDKCSIRNGHDRSSSVVARPGTARNAVLALLAVLAVVCVAALMTWLVPTPPRDANVGASRAEVPSAGANGWRVGMLRADGLRIVVSGRSDASAVLDADQFSRPEVRRGYRIAAKIPALLNRLYCWCGCENRGVHRSSLQCFEDRMAEDCAVCLGTAEIAFEMSEKGITDAAKIQAAVDVRWGPRR
ncbi:PCYCGC motif-containing (lipo)protein [Sphaerotilus sp.]|uniref:PCYCGC motif-containing (lipo)protein n=1 Tax=Sphaerotilus sp. TaxID=2093942 RepID=UPI002ACD9D41|nr:PCYCGC motif-containing (lipo)protein [Sphaerotilus sp.]MDZ7855766.1 PCYCGC motif-containing (lipo)protein [Sphaerotilus sp.]